MQLSLIDLHGIRRYTEFVGRPIEKHGLYKDGRLGCSGKITKVVTMRWDLDAAKWAFTVYRTEDFKTNECDLFDKLPQVDKQSLEGQLKANESSYNFAFVALFPRGFKEELVFGLATL
jgi:hypothetical protein